MLNVCTSDKSASHLFLVALLHFSNCPVAKQLQIRFNKIIFYIWHIPIFTVQSYICGNLIVKIQIHPFITCFIYRSKERSSAAWYKGNNYTSSLQSQETQQAKHMHCTCSDVYGNSSHSCHSCHRL